MPTPFRYDTPTNPYADSIGSLLLKRGEIEANRSAQVAAAQARAAQASGEAWGGAVRDIGKAVGAIPAQIAEQKQQATAMDAAKLQLDQAKRTAAAQKAVDALPFYASGEGREAMLAALDGPARELAMEHYQKADEAKARLDQVAASTRAANLNADESQAKINAAQLDVFGALASGVKAHNYEPGAFFGAVADAVHKGLIPLEQAGPMVAHGIQNQDWIKQTTDELIARSPEQQTLNERRLQEQRLADAATASAADKTADNARADAAAKETIRHNKAMEARPVAGAGSPNDVQLTVQGMKEGTLPPQLPGRASKEYIALMAEAKRQSYDLAGAATDWVATQKHIATLNGAQQTRIAQAIDNTSHSLDVIDDLASQWKGGKFPILNSVTIKTAKAGLLGPQYQALAVKLDSQIADVTAELANVYMGGNSPTDHALDLASKNLRADWSEPTLKAMLAQTRTNLQIRQNSMRNVGVAGASANNPYAPAAPAASGPDLSGLVPGHGRTFNSGAFAGQTWTLGPDGAPKRVK